MPYRPSPRGGAFIVPGGGDFNSTNSNAVLLDEITASGISHTPPDTPTADESMSLYAKRVAAARGRITPGTATYSFRPSDAMAAWRDLQALQRSTAGGTRYIREEQGIIDDVVTGATPAAAGVAIAVSSGVATATFSGTAVPSDIKDDAGWDTGKLVVANDIAYSIEQFTAAGNTAIVRRVGAVADNIVTPDSVAIAAVGTAIAFTLYDYAVRRSFQATLNSINPSASATERTAEVVFQISQFETETYLLADSARTIVPRLD